MNRETRRRGARGALLPFRHGPLSALPKRCAFCSQNRVSLATCRGRSTRCSPPCRLREKHVQVMATPPSMAPPSSSAAMHASFRAGSCGEPMVAPSSSRRPPLMRERWTPEERATRGTNRDVKADASRWHQREHRVDQPLQVAREAQISEGIAKQFLRADEVPGRERSETPPCPPVSLFILSRSRRATTQARREVGRCPSSPSSSG